MSERTSYEPGTPCWIDLGTPDQDAAGEFYGALFGWELKEDENAEQTGGYRTAQKNGKAVGGVMKLMQQVYFAVEDTDATVEKAKQGGGSVMFGPIDIPAGRFAILTDPFGASFAAIALSEEAQANA